MSAEPATGPRAAARLIASRNFGPYFVGNATSASGTWFYNLAASVFVYRQTHSPLLLGVLNFSNFIPMLVLAPWTGAAADRFDRRRLLLVTQLASTFLAAVLAALAWVGLAPVWVVIFFAALLGIASAYSAPASQALIGSLVPRNELQSAVALNSMTYNLARAIGPALAGLSVKALGIPASFAINAASYLLLVLGVAVVRPRRTAKPPRTRLRDSLNLVRANPRLLALLLIVAAVGFGSDPVNTEAPAFAQVFVGHSIDLWAGLIIGAFGLGAVSAAFLLAGRVAGTAQRMAVTLLLLTAGVAGFSLSPWLRLGFAFLFVGGFGYLASNTSATSRLQLEVEDNQRGRVMALWAVAFMGLRPFASIADGVIADAFGVRTAGVVLAIPPLVAAAVIVLFLRRGVPRRRAAPAPYPPPRV